MVDKHTRCTKAIDAVENSFLPLSGAIFYPNRNSLPSKASNACVSEVFTMAGCFLNVSLHRGGSRAVCDGIHRW